MFNWLKNLLYKIFPWFQKSYDWLDDLHYDSKTESLIKQIWESLEPEVKKALMALIAAIAAKYGVDKAKQIFSDTVGKITPFKIS